MREKLKWVVTVFWCSRELRLRHHGSIHSWMDLTCYWLCFALHQILVSVGEILLFYLQFIVRNENTLLGNNLVLRENNTFYLYMFSA